MKSILVFFLSFLLAGIVLHGQDYRNIINDGTAFYTGTNSQPGFLSGVKADSVLPQGNGDTLFLAANTMRPMTPPGPLYDTVGGILGRRIEKLNNGWFRFYNATGDTIFLNSAATLNATWRFITLPQKSEIRATCTSIQPATFLGTSDTVKEFTLQAKDSNGVNIANYFNGKTIRLSRRYGFRQVYDLYRFPAQTGLFTLEGRTSPPIGFQGLTWHDVYDYEVGDVFHILKHENYQVTSQHYTTDHRYIRTITSKQVAAGGGTVTYTYDYCDEQTYFNIVSGYVTAYFSGTSQETHPYTYAPASGSGTFVPDPFDRNGYRFFSTLQHFVSGVPSCGQNTGYYQCCWKPNPTYNQYINEQEYARGLGKVHDQQWMYYNWQVYYNYEDLVYYKKGTQQWGSPFYADCAAMIPTFSVSPAAQTVDYLAGSTAVINITTNRSWSITILSGDSRFTFDPLGGQGNAAVTVTAKYTNTTGNPIHETIQINYPGSTKYYMVSQLPNTTPFIISYPDTLILGWQSGTHDTLQITTNQSWYLQSQGDWPFWATVSKDSGLYDAVLIFNSTAENSSSAIRTAPLTIVNPAGNKNILLMQQAKYGTGIGNRSVAGITVAPDPIRETAVVSVTGLPKNTEKQLVLYDFTGRKVWTDTFISDTYVFRRGNLAPGMYLLKINYMGDTSSVLKVIIQ